MLNIKNSIFILIISCIAACSTNKNIETTPINKEHTEIKLKNPPSAFQLSGAIAINKQHDGFSAAIKWTQANANQYNIKISSPLSGKTLIVTKENGVITYQEGAKLVKADNAEKLLAKEAKIYLPVTSLYYWVRAIPAPFSKHKAYYNESGQLSNLKQQDFDIQYSEYFKDNLGFSLPRKIKLIGHGISIKLVIKNWERI